MPAQWYFYTLKFSRRTFAFLAFTDKEAIEIVKEHRGELADVNKVYCEDDHVLFDKGAP